MKTFEIAVKSYYHELSEWCYVLVKADNREEALLSFAKRHKLRATEIRHPESWRWYEGDFFMAFRYIKETRGKRRGCILCHGTGMTPGDSAGK
ncbi:MAG: hypothetical protein ACRD3A_11670 [Terriglobales bacterium]